MESSSHDKKPDPSAVFRRLLRFMGSYCKGLAVSVIFITLSSLFNDFDPLVLGMATDALTGLVTGGEPVYGETRRLTVILILLVSIHAFYAVFRYISTVILVRVSQKTIRDLRNGIGRKFVELPLNYSGTNTYRDVLSRITNDVGATSNSLQQSLEQIVTTVTSALCTLATMLFISPILMLIGIVTVPLALVFSARIAGASQEYFKNRQETLGELNGYVEEIYTGHTIVSAYDTEEETIDEFEETSRTLYDSGWRSQFMSSIMMPVTQGAANLRYVLVVIVGGTLATSGRITVGMIQSSIQYLRQFSQLISQMVQIIDVLRSTTTAATRVFELMDETEEVTSSEHPVVLESVDGSMEFKYVKFGYPPYHAPMHDVGFEVEPGGKVVIVGSIGAGKTTLINLLPRSYDVDDGKVLVSGISIRKMRRMDLRAVFGLILQGTWLFTSSVMENIRYGRLDVGDEEVMEAVRAARADIFIHIPSDGCQLVPQEGAANLAWDGRQLLTIARAILSDSPIMTLDETTSSADTRTKVLIQEVMAVLMKGWTSFVIAHKLSTTKDADMVLCMQEGDIKEVGTYGDLTTRDGLYAKLYNSQFANENG